MLPVVILVVGPDIFFPAIQLFACNSVGTHQAALAGSLFNVTTRLATSIGLAISASVQSVAMHRYLSMNPTPAGGNADNGGNASAAVLEEYRAVGWLCFGSCLIAAVIALVYLRGTSLIVDERDEGMLDRTEEVAMEIRLPSGTSQAKDADSSGQCSPVCKHDDGVTNGSQSSVHSIDSFVGLVTCGCGRKSGCSTLSFALVSG